MNETLLLALISAGSGLVGVIVGTVLPWFREGWNNKRKARYLAIRVVCILDEFLEKCAQVVGDDGLCEGQENAEGCREAQVAEPSGLPLPDDVDWKSIDHRLMYKVLALPSRIDGDNRAISSLGAHLFPLDYAELFEERQHRYACLGIDAADLAQELRKTYRIPSQEFGGWDPMGYLRGKKARIEKLRADREKQPPFSAPCQFMETKLTENASRREPTDEKYRTERP